MHYSVKKKCMDLVSRLVLVATHEMGVTKIKPCEGHVAINNESIELIPEEGWTQLTFG